MRILIADDEPDTRDTMKMVLEARGHRVATAANGKEAAERATACPPDVVFMDMKMPVMDGITATRLIRENASTATVPIVCISAYLGQPEWRERALEAGCIDCLSKPVDFSRLYSVLSKIDTRH